MQKKCFTIQSNKNSKYKIVVDYRNGNPQIYIGGSKHYCISITGFELDIKSGDTCRNLHIRNVNFSHKATDMMKALLYFIRIKQTEIGYRIDNKCKITFIDTSENQFCGNLSSYYLAFSKKTWYEKDFGASLINDKHNKLTPTEKNELRIPEKYMIMDKKYGEIFDVVNMYKDQKKILDDVNYHTNKILILLEEDLRRNISNPTIIENVLKIYESTTTIYEFFNKLKTKYGNETCKELNLPLWLDKFIKFTLGFKFIKNQKWHIDCDKIIGDDLYEIFNCENIPGKYLAVKQTGNGEKKKLTKRQRESYTNPNWIGWIDMNIKEYNTKDYKFLKNLKNNF